MGQDRVSRVSNTDGRATSRVAILLCTYQGEEFLPAQLDSFFSQTHPAWEVWASDDGSRDNTLSVLESYRARWGTDRLRIVDGRGAGFCANFLSLVCHDGIRADFFAYSDQDDIWEAGKLERALNCLRAVPADTPALYCSRTRLVDVDNREIGSSPLFRLSPGFANAIVQNIGGGNTMLFNGAARQILLEAGKDVNVLTHDWWTYLVVAGCGGKVIYDAWPSVRYRQHGANVIGTNSSWRARAMRIRLLWRGFFRDLTGRHLAALQRLERKLTPGNKAIVERFSRARNQSLWLRLPGIARSGVYRQTWLGNLGLIAAAVFKKI
jgi:glycosyltransferase involved in cell wall biosynthesis